MDTTAAAAASPAGMQQQNADASRGGVTGTCPWQRARRQTPSSPPRWRPGPAARGCPRQTACDHVKGSPRSDALLAHVQRQRSSKAPTQQSISCAPEERVGRLLIAQQARHRGQALRRARSGSPPLPAPAAPPRVHAHLWHALSPRHRRRLRTCSRALSTSALRAASLSLPGSTVTAKRALDCVERSTGKASQAPQRTAG